MNNKPISVIMSMYREEPEHLKLAVESVLNQTYKDFEFIIVADDPKNQELITIIEHYRQKDSRIRFYINDKNMGLTHCRNKSISLCLGDYIAIMDADDICNPDRLIEQKSYLDNHQEIDIVFTGRVEIDENGDVIVPFSGKNFKDDDIKNMLKFCDIITNPTVMIRTDAVKCLGGLRTIVCAEDYDLWLRCVSTGLKIHYIDKPLLSYRIRSDSLSHKNYAKTWVSTEYVKKLYKQRIQTGSDSYSSEHFENFVKQSLLGNEKSTKRFNRAYDIYCDALDKAKKGNVFGSVFGLLHSILVHFEIVKVFSNSVALKKCEKKQS